MIVVYGIAILITIAVIYPVWFVLIASFSDSSDVANGNVWLFIMQLQKIIRTQ